MTSDYGTLCDYQSGDEIRPATRYELRQSMFSKPAGAFLLDGRSVYVADESRSAREEVRELDREFWDQVRREKDEERISGC